MWGEEINENYNLNNMTFQNKILTVNGAKRNEINGMKNTRREQINSKTEIFTI